MPKGKKAIQTAEHKAVRDSINSYQDTVTGLICFGHVLTWDDSKRKQKGGSCFCYGRRMDPSPANKIQAKDSVTPDLVTVRDKDNGVIGEAKISFHKNEDDNQRELMQFLKYDDDLTGWPSATTKIENHDIALLVHYSRKGDTQDILDEAQRKNLLSMTRKFFAVCFQRTTQGSEYMTLEHFYGQMSDAALQKRMRPLSVPLEKVLPLHPYLLYDAMPEMPLLLELAWTKVFNRLVPPENYLKVGQKIHEIDCTVDRIRDMIAESCGPKPTDNRDPQIPQRDWIKKMLDYLVKMELAKCPDKAKEPDRYTVFYRWKQTPLDSFIERYLSLKRKTKLRNTSTRRGGRRRTDNPNQGKLFE